MRVRAAVPGWCRERRPPTVATAWRSRATVTSGSNAHVTSTDAWNSYSIAYCVAAGASIAAAVLALQLSDRAEHKSHGVAADDGAGEGAVIAALE